MTDEKIMATIKPDGEYWQPEIETMPREQLEALQIKKLKARQASTSPCSHPSTTSVWAMLVSLPIPSTHWKISVRSPSPRSRICATTIPMAS